MLEAGERVPDLEPFCLAELLHDVVHKFALDFQTRNIRLETRIPSNIPHFPADIALIERVLDNLIDNALKHTEPGATIGLNVENHQ